MLKARLGLLENRVHGGLKNGDPSQRRARTAFLFLTIVLRRYQRLLHKRAALVVEQETEPCCTILGLCRRRVLVIYGFWGETSRGRSWCCAGRSAEEKVCVDVISFGLSMPSCGSIGSTPSLALFLALFFFTRCSIIPVDLALSLASFFRPSSFFPLPSLCGFPSLLRLV